jgi:hypothetical protein
MTERISRRAHTGHDRRAWWAQVGAALEIDAPDRVAGGLPFQQDGITCQFVTNEQYNQALLLIAMPTRPDIDETDVHRGLLHFQLRHWADSSLLFGLDAQDGSLFCGTRIPLDPLPLPDSLALTVRTRVQQTRQWAEQMAFVSRQMEASA